MHTDPALHELRASVAAPLRQPSPDEIRTTLAAICSWTLHDDATLSQQVIGNNPTPAQLRSLIPPTAPELGRPLAEVLEDVFQHIVPNSFRPSHPRFLAFIPGAGSLPAMMGEWLTAAANIFAGVWLEGASASHLETSVLNWFASWLGLPDSTRGIITSGGSEANLTALVVARQSIPLVDRPKMVLYLSGERHYSIDRAANIMGIAPENLHRVPVDADRRLRGNAITEAIQRDRSVGRMPWAVVANAGATNTGTIDALAEIAAVCQYEKLWFHVDAAYGWPGIFTHEAEQLLPIADADSVTLDPHKWFAQPFEAGCVLVRDGQRLKDAFAYRADYMQDVVPQHDEINYADHGLGLTRRFRALKIWFSVQALGVEWFRELARHSVRLAQYAQARLRQAGFTILCEQRLSIVCFRYMPQKTLEVNAFNARLVEALRATGQAFLSSTMLDGQYALRLCFINYRTTADDVDFVLALLQECAAKLEHSFSLPES